MTDDSTLSKNLYNRQCSKYCKVQLGDRLTSSARKGTYSLMGNIKNKKMLFAGCGNGHECETAARENAIVTGIDVSDKEILFAKKNIKDAKFLVMDFEKTVFKKNSFDIIVSIFSIMYKKNLISVLKEWRRILKADGFVIIVVPHPVRKMIAYNNMNYFVRGKRWENWKGIKRFNYYRLFEDYVDCFVGSKFKIAKLLEPKLNKNEIENEIDIKHPNFLIFKLVKT
ncbi:MAG: class I SAM-dependent methyltransferase [Candidatus Aenigmarchaeota archaeon]|nr:class I SAM-dependent methyltransferase [Candidatus Aenigmarchaeota archaeon]